MSDEVVIAKADPAWPQLFAQERARLLAAFGSQFLAVEHFGSTAIPHLDAKPIVDILGGVVSMQAADALLEPLCQFGYDTSPEFNATLSDRRFLLRWPEGVRTHHLHLVVYEGAQWKQRLRFRDRLRADAALTQQYQDLKYDLAAKFWNDREAYTAAKAEFVARVAALDAPVGE